MKADVFDRLERFQRAKTEYGRLREETHLAHLKMLERQNAVASTLALYGPVVHDGTKYEGVVRNGRPILLTTPVELVEENGKQTA